MALVLSQAMPPCQPGEFLQLHGCACNGWPAQRFDLPKTVKLIVGASRSDGPTIAPLCEGTRFETAVMFWGLRGGRAMLTQLVPKLSAWEEKEKNFAIWGYGRMGVSVCCSRGRTKPWDGKSRYSITLDLNRGVTAH